MFDPRRGGHLEWQFRERLPASAFCLIGINRGRSASDSGWKYSSARLSSSELSSVALGASSAAAAAARAAPVGAGRGQSDTSLGADDLGARGDGLYPWEAEVVRQAGALAVLIVLNSNPAVQACQRMGLPADYLYVHRNAVAGSAGPFQQVT